MKNKVLISIFIFLLSIFLLTINVMAEEFRFEEKWKGTDINLYNYENTSDDGYIVVGNKLQKNLSEGEILFDAIILKIDSNGNEEWRKTFGGSDFEYFCDVVEDKDNNFIAIGITHSTDIEGFENDGQEKGIIVKYNKNGELLWKNIYSKEDDNYFSDIEISKNNEVYVVGNTREDNNMGGILLKYNQNDGVLNSEKKYNTPNEDEEFDKIRILDDESCIIIGRVGTSTEHKGFVVKYDKEFKLKWSRAVSFGWLTNFEDILVTNKGEGIIIGCCFESKINPHYNYKILIYKFDINTGEYIEGNKLDQIGTLYNFVEIEDGYIAIGEIPQLFTDEQLEYGVTLFKFDKNWNIKWKKTNDNIRTNLKKAFNGKITIDIMDSESYNYGIFEISEKCLILGDVNEDGKITLADYTKILAHVKKTQLLTGDALKAADVNEDGKVTLADYTKVLAHVKKTQLLK